MKISLFKNAKSTSPIGDIELIDVLMSIKNGSEYYPLIQQYRRTLDKSDKVLIPCFTASGTFTKRSISDLAEYNGVVCLDIDKKDNPDIDISELKSKLMSFKFIFAFHHSVGGEGLAVYIRTNNKDAKFHSFLCGDYIEQFNNKLNVVCDRSCKDVSRLRFLSFDPDLYVNESSTIMPVSTEKYEHITDRSATSVSVQSALSGSNQIIQLANKIVENGVDITSDYHDWWLCACAISDGLGESGRSVFHMISQMYHKYKFEEAEKTYTFAMSRNPQVRVTKNTLFKIAADYGIKVYE